MNKKPIIITVIILVILVALGYTFSQKRKTPVPAQSSQSIATSTPPVKETTLTEEYINAYTATIKSGDVIHIREILTKYLGGKTSDKDIPMSKIIVKSNKVGDEKCGLKSFSKDYYKSRFFVLSLKYQDAGGYIISIIFKDKPDLAFNAWVAPLPNGGWEMKSFCGDSKLSVPELQEKTLIPLGKYLNDPAFSI